MYSLLVEIARLLESIIYPKPPDSETEIRRLSDLAQNLIKSLDAEKYFLFGDDKWRRDGKDVVMGP